MYNICLIKLNRRKKYIGFEAVNDAFYSPSEYLSIKCQNWFLLLADHSFFYNRNFVSQCSLVVTAVWTHMAMFLNLKFIFLF